MRFFRPFFLSEWLFPEALFRIRSSEKTVCITFDDGPDPESTPDMLGILDEMNIKAVFFCNGTAAEKYPELVDGIRKRGHKVGNHGYHHINGWETRVNEYCDNAERASQFTSDSLFRPPYGKIRCSQYHLMKKSFKIVFWDIMSFDYDITFGAEKSLGILSRKLRPGSIIVLHDTPSSTCRSFLKSFIRDAMTRGFRFENAI